MFLADDGKHFWIAFFEGNEVVEQAPPERYRTCPKMANSGRFPPPVA